MLSKIFKNINDNEYNELINNGVLTGFMREEYYNNIPSHKYINMLKADKHPVDFENFEYYSWGINDSFYSLELSDNSGNINPELIIKIYLKQLFVNRFLHQYDDTHDEHMVYRILLYSILETNLGKACQLLAYLLWQIELSNSKMINYYMICAVMLINYKTKTLEKKQIEKLLFRFPEKYSLENIYAHEMSYESEYQGLNSWFEIIEALECEGYNVDDYTLDFLLA